MILYHQFDTLTNTRGDSLPGYRVVARLPNGGAVQPIYGDLGGTPIAVTSGIANTAITDAAGNYSFFVQPGATYDFEYSTPDGVFLFATRNVPIVGGVLGPTGPSNNSRVDLTALKAAAITDATSLYDGALWSWTAGDFTGLADDLNIVKANSTPLSVGAWVRQKASGVTFRRVQAASTRQVQDKLSEIALSVDDFGAVGAIGTDDTAAVTAAANALKLLGGGRLQFTHGKTYVMGDVPMLPGVTYRGTGRSAIDLVNTTPGARIICKAGAGSIFKNTGSTITGVRFEDLYLWSQPGGGHVFDWSYPGLVAKIELTGCNLIQENANKHIVKGTSAGGVFSIWMHDFEYQYAAGNTVAPFNFVSPTINSIVIERFWSTCSSEQTSGVWSIYFESSNPGGGGINCIVRDGVFELPGGGAVKMLSCSNSGIENCSVYDMTVTPNNPMFVIDDGASAPPSSNCWLRGVRSTVGTPAKPDVFLNTSVAGQGQFEVSACTLSYLDGGGVGAGPTILITGGAITTLQNLNYTRINGGPTLDMHFGTTDAGGRSWTLWNGYAGNANGFLNVFRDGAYAAAFSPAGAFQVGGTRTAPNFQATASGMVYGTGFYANSVKVVGAQQAAIANATDAASTQARLNDVLAALRTHGLIAT